MLCARYNCSHNSTRTKACGNVSCDKPKLKLAFCLIFTCKPSAPPMIKLIFLPLFCQALKWWAKFNVLNCWPLSSHTTKKLSPAASNNFLASMAWMFSVLLPAERFYGFISMISMASSRCMRLIYSAQAACTHSGILWPTESTRNFTSLTK